MKKQNAVRKRAAWMGCDSLVIVTPYTNEKTLMELEMWSDVILGWDGNEVAVLKSRFNPLPLLAPIPVLRRIAASLPTAPRSSLAGYCAALAKPCIHPARPVRSDELQGRRYQRISSREMSLGQLRDSRKADGWKSYPRKNNIQSPSNRLRSRVEPNKSKRTIKRPIPQR
jgi:hypothetical protein